MFTLTSPYKVLHPTLPASAAISVLHPLPRCFLRGPSWTERSLPRMNFFLILVSAVSAPGSEWWEAYLVLDSNPAKILSQLWNIAETTVPVVSSLATVRIKWGTFKNTCQYQLQPQRSQFCWCEVGARHRNRQVQLGDSYCSQSQEPQPMHTAV